MSLSIRLRALAQVEFNDVANEYEYLSPGLGVRFTRAVDAVLERIGRMPEIYAVLFRDVRCTNVRRFPFVVLYRVTSDDVVVVGILPAKSNPVAWADRN